jgi:HEAT repeat protein
MRQRIFPLAIALALLVPRPFIGAVCGAEADEETTLIARLQSPATLREKDAACARLKYIGTARSVPALAALLTDEQLSHSARYVLEGMSVTEARQALVDALGKTRGLIRMGVIHSLGVRGEAPSVPALVPLLADPDAAVAGAAAGALGRIGGTEAGQALSSAFARSSGVLRDSMADALLLVASRLAASGDRARAYALCESIDAAATTERLRLAAYQGMIRSSTAGGLELIIRGIIGVDGARQAAALQCVCDLADSKATLALGACLPQLPALVQAALVDGLGQRGEPAAAPAILTAAQAGDAPVALAAASALGLLGDAAAVSWLTRQAASTNAIIQKAARQSLLQLHRGAVAAALLSMVESREPDVQVEAVRALGNRSDTKVIPRLLDLAEHGTRSTRLAALKALGSLGTSSTIGPLTRLVMDVREEGLPMAARDALEVVCRRLPARGESFEIEPLVRGLAEGTAEARVALLPVCRGIVDPRLREALRRAAQDAAAPVRQAARRAMCATRDAELLPDLLQIARREEIDLRALAMRGVVRLAVQEEGVGLSNRQRLDALRSILGLARTPEEQRLALAGLAELPEWEALQLVLPLLDLPVVRAEAAQAALKIASAIQGARPSEVEFALKTVLSLSSDPATQKSADALLKQLHSKGGYLTAWQAAGPYLQAGKDYAALFDLVFPPETAEAKGANWRLLPAGSDPQRPWLMDLLKALGGEQRVAYARTRVYSEGSQAAILELGSDDGVKVWLNDQLVYAHNIARPLTAGSDKATITLRPGWNTLLLKITQNNQAWAFGARLTKSDGSPLAGFRIDASPGGFPE